jgi:prevent-host-death family protein
MPKSLTITETRAKLLDLADSLSKDVEKGTVAITRHGEPVLALMPWELYESLVETLEILSDEELMQNLRKSIQQAQKGKLIPLETVEDRLGL